MGHQPVVVKLMSPLQFGESPKPNSSKTAKGSGSRRQATRLISWYSMAMNWRERIAVDPKVLVGKPVIKGTRLAVEFIVDLLAAGWTQKQILDNYPHICQEDIQACLAYAAELLHTEHIVPLQPA
jgi:uncharacterized protein (DUF433 family)